MEDNPHKKTKIVAIIIAIFVLIFAISAFFVMRSYEKRNSLNNGEIKIPIVLNSTEIKTRDLSWNAFQDFLSKASAGDIEGIKEITYQQSEACSDINREEECLMIMESVYELGKDLKKEDFVYVWEDRRQIILSTEAKRETIGEMIGFTKGFIYLVKEEGIIKVLTFNPARGWLFTPREIDTPDFIEEKLQAIILDTDNDGLTDQQETCAGLYFEDPECTNTDPEKRDTTGNGWWDGVEFYFRN